jgi:hypothetical protein
MLFADVTEIHSLDIKINNAAENINRDLMSIEKWLVKSEMVAFY